jgi:hypothetical protein
MVSSTGRYPEIIFLRRANNTGYGFFYTSDADFRHAADSFTQPVLRTFKGPPIPNQPDPQDHLRAAIAAFLGQAFDRAVDPTIGAEGISRAAAAFARQAFRGATPTVVMIERGTGRLNMRAAPEFMRHPGFPRAVVVDGDTHGGDARFFDSYEDYANLGETEPSTRSWLTQIIYRLYDRTPSVMVGRPLTAPDGKAAVECRALFLGVPAPLTERAEAEALLAAPPRRLPPPVEEVIVPEPEPEDGEFAALPPPSDEAEEPESPGIGRPIPVEALPPLEPSGEPDPFPPPKFFPLPPRITPLQKTEHRDEDDQGRGGDDKPLDRFEGDDEF